MLPTLVSIVVSLGVGFLVGGCTGRDDMSQSLLQRNTQLENQVAAQTTVTTGLMAALILTACGLAASLVWRTRKGGPHGSTTKWT